MIRTISDFEHQWSREIESTQKVIKHLSDAADMYGQKWKRGFTLQALIAHEIHHRGEMIVLMRIAGLAVPGVYGPTRDEWANYGMAPPSV